MDGNEKSQWGRAEFGSLLEKWTKGADGEPELKINMLEAYGIPCLKAYPGDGGFGKLILGMSGQGVDILVPKSMYEDAVALCNEEGVVEDD